MGTSNHITAPLYTKLLTAYENNGHTKNVDLSTLRGDAFAAFKSKGFPTMKDEDWKFTNITPFLSDDYQFVAYHTVDEAVLKAAVEAAIIPDLDAYTLVVFNGVIQADLSVLPDAAAVSIQSLNEITDPAVFDNYLALSAVGATSMVSLNTALYKDGYFIEVKKGVEVAKPIHIIQLYSANDNVLVQQRNHVVVNQHAKAELIETAVILQGSALLFVNSVSHLAVKENAQLKQYKIQNNETSERLVNYSHISQERDSRYDNFTFCLPGAQLIRNNLEVELNGTATETHLMGLYLVGDHQLTDNHTAIHHKSPNCESNEIYKGVLLNNGRAVFNGKVFVERAAQKTNAFQQNNNLLLSDKAQVYAKPQLEIFADDVKCSHGCTVGQFDPESLFYLRSRGISEESSRKLLVEAFMFDVTQKIDNEALKEYVQCLIYDKMENSFSAIV